MSTQAKRRHLPAEPDAHLLARHYRTGVRILLTFSLVATIVTLLFFREVAYLAAIPIPILYVILSFANYLEVRSRASELRHGDSELRHGDRSHLSKEEVGVDVETAGIILVLKVLGVLAIGTFIIAAAFFDWQIVGIVAAALFLLATLINLPYLPLFFTEAQRDEMEKIRREDS